MKRVSLLILGLLLLTACAKGGSLSPYSGSASTGSYFGGLWANLAGQLKLDESKPVLLRLFAMEFDAGGGLQSANMQFQAMAKDGQVHEYQVSATGGKWRQQEVPLVKDVSGLALGQLVFKRLDQSPWNDLLQQLGKPDGVSLHLNPERKCQLIAEGGGRRWTVDSCAPAVAWRP